MSGLGGTRLASRLARREVRRRPGRTLLVALLVAVPVGAMVVAAVLVRTATLSPEEDFRRSFGRADVVRHSPEPLDAAALPAGSRIVTVHQNYRVVRTDAGGRVRAVLTDLPLTDPLTDGIVRITEGRAPAQTGEVLLSPGVADDLDAHVGDVLALDRPETVRVTVTGLGERRSFLDESMVVFAPGTPSSSWIASGDVEQLVDLPDSMSTTTLRSVVDSLIANEGGAMASPAIYPHGQGDDATSAMRWSWVIGALVLTVVGIVIASAFAAGARRQLTTLGQLAANGAAPKILRRVLLLQGTWTGVLGSALGLALGAAGLAALAPRIDDWSNEDIGAWDVRVGDLVPVVLLGILAATIAALVPARTTSRIPVLAALAGRRPLGSVPRWLTVSGLVSGAAGLGLLGLAVLGANGGNGGSNVWAATAIVGGVAVLLGACAIAPGYVSVLEPAAARLHGPWRLAARSLGRQRTRTGAVVSAVCATGALVIGASAMVLATDAKQRDEPQYLREDLVVVQKTQWRAPAEPGPSMWEPAPLTLAPDAAFVRSLRDALPSAHVAALQAVDATDLRWPWQLERIDPGAAINEPNLDTRPNPPIGIADDELLRVYDLDGDARAALASTGALVLGAAPGTGTVSLSRLDGSALTFDIAVASDADLDLGSLPTMLLTPGRAAQLGLTSVPGPVVFDLPRAPSEEQRTALTEAVEDNYLDEEVDGLGGTFNTFTDVQYDWPRDELNPLLIEALLGGIALLFMLFVVVVSLGLAAAETRDERDILGVVGASPRVMRRTSSRKAVLLTVLGVLLALPVGFLPVMVFTGAADSDLPLVFPWRTATLLLIAIPVIAGVITTFGSAIALRFRPVRVSTMTFE